MLVTGYVSGRARGPRRTHGHQRSRRSGRRGGPAQYTPLAAGVIAEGHLAAVELTEERFLTKVIHRARRAAIGDVAADHRGVVDQRGDD